MVAQPRSEEIIQSNSDLRVSQVEMVSERCICRRTRQHEDVRLPIQGLDGHFCNPQYECINKEMGKRTNLWVLESVRSLPTEGRFRSCLPSSSRTRNAASISNELQHTSGNCFDYVVALSLTNICVECGRQLHRNGDAKSSVFDERTHFVVCAIHHYVLLHSIFS